MMLRSIRLQCWLVASSSLLGVASSSSGTIARVEDLVGIPDWQMERIHYSELDDHRFLQEVIGFVDPEVCYPALEGADANGDGIVDADEYVTFCKSMGPEGFLEGITTFEELPLQLKSNFNVLVCLCQTDPADESCCVGDGVGISTDGAREGEIPSPAEQSYLFIVCSLTGSAIERILTSIPPSAAPTGAPTNSTAAPTAASASPTATVTASPSDSPSIPPTMSPVEPTTTSPSPTLAPVTTAPTPQPTTAAPTASPGPTSVPVTVEETVTTVYQIGVENGATQDVYEPQLVDAMDSLAPEVLANVLDSFRRRLSSKHRQLQSVGLPTRIDLIAGIDCPSVIPTEDICEEVTASMTLIFQPDQAEDSANIAATFLEELNSAIARGELQDALNLEWPGGDVYILDDTVLFPPTDDDDTDRTISGGGITGIVIGSLAAICAFGFIAIRTGETKEEPEELVPAPKEVEKEVEVEPYDAEFAATLGATSPDYGKSHDAMMDNDEAIANMSLDSSSNAGSSGWSSSAGVSSLNTGSHDGLSTDGPITAFGSTLAALGMSTQPDEVPSSPKGAVESTPTVTRADLDSAIESGDWAAVGATAALLAAASDSQSYSSNSGLVDQSGTISRSEDSSSLDAARAAELDHLVESGDWEGVVLAAAKFEAAETVTSGSDSRAQDSSSQASSPSKAQRRQEIRAEVEDLVRRVVPEEIQNVDEMMVQFRGREEELIETLRTMEERAVAQKARQGAQKQAKVQAKQKTPEERKADATALLAAISGPGSPDQSDTIGGSFDDESPAFVRSLGTGQVSSAVKSLGTGQVEGTFKSKTLGTGSMAEAVPASQRDRKQSALEEAIEKGDWEAVGEAAAMLSDQSLASSVETDELNRLADGTEVSDMDSSKGGLSDKAEELEALIERGDWTGVVNVAASQSEKKSSEKRKKEAEEEARRQRRQKHLNAEKEALAQAEIWEAIAEQTKQEATQSTTDQAASAAADWAIGRSLQALVQAEQGDTLTKEESAKAMTQSDDEEEV